jgi:two-component system CheB/CheR fusion protein
MPGTLRDGRRYAVGMAVDLTERKRIEADLAVSKEQLRLVIEGAVEHAIISLNLDRCITSWNTGAERIFGYLRDEILDQSADRLFTPEDLAAGGPVHEVEIALAEGRAADERWHVRKDGSRFWGSGVTLPMHERPGGPPTGFIKILRDETPQREAQLALETSRKDLITALHETDVARAQAEAATRAKDHFLAVLSHELRTPLTPVLMAAATLSRHRDLPEPVRDALGIIKRNVQLEAKLVDDLLDVSRIVHGKMELERVPIDMHEVVQRAVAVMQPDLEKKNQRLTVALEAERHHLTGDATRLQQVVWNLLGNASKFSPEGGRIQVRTRNEAGSLLVEVTDNGIGIEPEAAARIFEAFAQANVTITREFGGLGLGLSISKATVGAHGGHLRVESAGSGQGATFIVSLPLPSGE